MHTCHEASLGLMGAAKSISCWAGRAAGASVAGYALPMSTLSTAVNGAEGSWDTQDAVAVLDGGELREAKCSP
jgi:hypothetical protein